jgi:hypothetical protein
MSCTICHHEIKVEALTLTEDCPRCFCYSCTDIHAQFRNWCLRCFRKIEFLQKYDGKTGEFLGRVEIVPSLQHDTEVTLYRSQMITPDRRRDSRYPGHFPDVIPWYYSKDARCPTNFILTLGYAIWFPSKEETFIRGLPPAAHNRAKMV